MFVAGQVMIGCPLSVHGRRSESTV